METFVIEERSKEDLKNPEWEDLLVLERAEDAQPILNNKYRGDFLFEISVVPKAVNVRYVDVYYPHSFGNNVWRYVDVVLERYVKVRIPYQPKNKGEANGPILSVVETRVSVSIPWNAAFTDEQLDIFMNALRKREPLKLKGALSFIHGGNSLEEVRKKLSEWDIWFTPSEINGIKVSGYGDE